MIHLTDNNSDKVLSDDYKCSGDVSSRMVGCHNYDIVVYDVRKHT